MRWTVNDFFSISSFECLDRRHFHRPLHDFFAIFSRNQASYEQGRHLRGLGVVAPPPLQGKRKKKKKKEKKEKREKKEKKKKERKKGTMNNVKLLHIKCCFFQFFNSPVALKI